MAFLTLSQPAPAFWQERAGGEKALQPAIGFEKDIRLFFYNLCGMASEAEQKTITGIIREEYRRFCAILLGRDSF